jgi:DNA-binding NtrC family response regulator
LTFPIKKNVLRELHVDNDPCVLEVSKQVLLKENNFEIDTATSVNTAIKKIGQKDYEAIFSGYQMRKKTGLKFLNILFIGTIKLSIIRTKLDGD